MSGDCPSRHHIHLEYLWNELHYPVSIFGIQQGESGMNESLAAVGE
jgi:hypothetical protein